MDWALEMLARQVLGRKALSMLPYLGMASLKVNRQPRAGRPRISIIGTASACEDVLLRTMIPAYSTLVRYLIFKANADAWLSERMRSVPVDNSTAFTGH